MTMLRRLALALVLCSTPALADSVSVSLNPKTKMGENYPSVNVQILEPVAGFRLQLKRSDGKDVDIKGGGRPGVTRNLDLPQPEGKFSYKGELTLNLPNGTTASMPLEFDTEMWGPLHMKVDKDKDIELEKRSVHFTCSRPCTKAHLTVLMDTGKNAFDADVFFDPQPAGTRLEATWPEARGQVMKIVLRVFDAAEFFTGIEFHPWRFDIPHEEVNFASGKFDITPEEQPKLDKAYRDIADAVRKYGQWAEVKLYLAGHTDTVGPTESNRTLSLNRARSLGQYLRKKGLSIPLFYEGFGEQALLVKTQDEVDELKNRRAEYILAVEAPKVTGGSWQPTWQKL